MSLICLLFAGDLERIVNLLLSLCSRLSRIDRSLLALQRDGLSPEEAAEERVRHAESTCLHHTCSSVIQAVKQMGQ